MVTMPCKMELFYNPYKWAGNNPVCHCLFKHDLDIKGDPIPVAEDNWIDIQLT